MTPHPTHMPIHDGHPDILFSLKRTLRRKVRCVLDTRARVWEYVGPIGRSFIYVDRVNASSTFTNMYSPVNLIPQFTNAG